MPTSTYGNMGLNHTEHSTKIFITLQNRKESYIVQNEKDKHRNHSSLGVWPLSSLDGGAAVGEGRPI